MRDHNRQQRQAKSSHQPATTDLPASAGDTKTGNTFWKEERRQKASGGAGGGRRGCSAPPSIPPPCSKRRQQTFSLAAAVAAAPRQGKPARGEESPLPWKRKSDAIPARMVQRRGLWILARSPAMLEVSFYFNEARWIWLLSRSCGFFSSPSAPVRAARASRASKREVFGWLFFFPWEREADKKKKSRA